MNLVVRHGAREEQVQVRRVEGGFEVSLGNRTYRIDAGSARPGLYSLLIDGAQHEAAVHRQNDGVYQVSTAQGASLVEVLDPLNYLASKAGAGKGAKRRQRVNAYMPGRVVALLAAEGQAVEMGNPLFELV